MNEFRALGWMCAFFLVASVGGSAASVPVDAGPAEMHALLAQKVDVAVPDNAKMPSGDFEKIAQLARPAGGHPSDIGVASWYDGPTQHTANGEVFDPGALAAASRTLPFDTRVRITNLRNGRSVVVRINDRGPYVRGRLIDLTPKAAEELGMKQRGLARVSIEVVKNDIGVAAGDPVLGN